MFKLLSSSSILHAITKTLESTDESLINERKSGGIALDEEFLVMFLRCREWDVQSAFEKVIEILLSH
jgi:hypothetical protein